MKIMGNFNRMQQEVIQQKMHRSTANQTALAPVFVTVISISSLFPFLDSLPNFMSISLNHLFFVFCSTKSHEISQITSYGITYKVVPTKSHDADTLKSCMRLSKSGNINAVIWYKVYFERFSRSLFNWD